MDLGFQDLLEVQSSSQCPPIHWNTFSSHARVFKGLDVLLDVVIQYGNRLANRFWSVRNEKEGFRNRRGVGGTQVKCVAKTLLARNMTHEYMIFKQTLHDV